MSKSTVFAPLSESLKPIRNGEGEIQTVPFLDTCRLIIPIIGNGNSTCS